MDLLWNLVPYLYYTPVLINTYVKYWIGLYRIIKSYFTTTTRISTI